MTTETRPPTTTRSTGRASPSRRAVIWLALLAPLACNLVTKVEKVPPQQWAKGRGPVVPHDKFPADCTLCHLAGSWHQIRSDFRFDHAKETGVALNGSHRTAECLRCHNDKGPVAKFASRGCAGCHEDWHRRKLGTNCGDCHDETNWLPKEVIARHNLTRFSLIGAHAGVACYRCHQGAQVGDFSRASIRCESCHERDLARTTAPNHLASGWTSDCQTCHVPIAWRGAGFVHTSWPLTGAHATTPCASCHVGGTYRGTPRDCVGCHLADYNNTTTPNHFNSGFPTTCESCHTTSTWKGAIFNHRFPLRGPHNQACATCHTTPGSQAFDCLVCHEHNKTKMDDVHKGKSGYFYSSTACYGCHPNGR